MNRLLGHGILSGLAGGLAMTLFTFVFGRGPIQAALDYEDDLAHVDGAAHTHEELFSRGVQQIGGAIGLLLFGIALGVIFSVVLGSLAARMGSISAMQASVRIGAVGFFVLVVVPFLKYPGNPPAVGDPETINQRTVYYFALLGASILLAVAVLWAVEASPFQRVGTTWFGFALYFGGLALIFTLMPDAIDPVTAPTDLVWNFRLASLGGLATAWTVMALTMGSLLTRDAQKAAHQDP